MADLAPADLSALIQVQRSVADTSRTHTSNRQTDDSAEQSKARDAANQFEALLIHNMLKSMRKTTMAENTSNQRALYDDMLDKNLADSMIKAGGLGIADQLMSQLHGKETSSDTYAPPTGAEPLVTRDRLRLRELASNLYNGPDKMAENRSSASLTETEFTAAGFTATEFTATEFTATEFTATKSTVPESGLARLKLLSRLWGQADDTPSGIALTRTEFLNTLAPHAQRSAQRLGTSTSAVLAIAALETGWGQTMLKDGTGQSANNYFGIKANAQDENYTRNTTTEYLNGTSQNVQAKFKAYDSTADSVEGFADFILENPRYSTALQHASNPERFLRELHDAGYATDPRYAEKAITVMRQVEQQTSKP